MDEYKAELLLMAADSDTIMTWVLPVILLVAHPESSIEKAMETIIDVLFIRLFSSGFA
jgi:hypothetical protein